MTGETLRCLLVKKLGKDRVEVEIEHRPRHELPEGDVLIEVTHSSLNFKDALALAGHPGIVRRFPHVPGIDAAGLVRESSSPRFRPGQPVVVAGHEFGAGRWGGLSELARVPAEWIVPLPEGMSPETAMAYGTAGFTAALSVRALIHNGIRPESGEVVVTGATGGVGVLALMLLAKLGYRPVAVTGKSDRAKWLTGLGAARVVTRDDIVNESDAPLLSARWAAAVDTAGGPMLTSLLRSTSIGGCVTACGMVAGNDIPLTVFPFILRGITLAGIDSAWIPYQTRQEVWTQLAGPWQLQNIDQVTRTISLEDVDKSAQAMRSGKHLGRTIVRISSDPPR